jgi:hypothetical protein
MSTMGWVFVLSPFIAAAVGFLVSSMSKNKDELGADVLS